MLACLFVYTLACLFFLVAMMCVWLFGCLFGRLLVYMSASSFVYTLACSFASCSDHTRLNICLLV